MARNLIKNGGFELGDTTHWDAYDEYSFTVVSSPDPVYEKTYAGKLTIDEYGWPVRVINTDYIPFNDGSLYFDAFLYVSETDTAKLYVEYYDKDKVSIQHTTYGQRTFPAFAWTEFSYLIPHVPRTRYVKVSVMFNNTTEGEYFLIDNVSVYRAERLGRYAGVIASDSTELPLLNLQLESIVGTQKIKEYNVAKDREARMFTQGLKAPILKITGLLDTTIQNRNDCERKLRDMLITTDKVLYINTIKGIAATVLLQRYMHDVHLPFWGTIDRFRLTALQYGQTLGYSFPATNGITDGELGGDATPVEGMYALNFKVVDLGATHPLSVYFEIYATPHELPPGDYEFIMRARSDLLEDTLTMEVSNEDTTSGWEESHDAFGTTRFKCLQQFLDKLYAGADNGIIYSTNDGHTWIEAYNTLQTEVHCLEVHEGKLYAGTGNNAKIYKMELVGNTEVWTEEWILPQAQTKVYALYSGYGGLYAGGDDSYLYKLSGGSWTEYTNFPPTQVQTIWAINADITNLYLGVTTSSNIGRVVYGYPLNWSYWGSINGTAVKALIKRYGMIWAGDNAGWIYYNPGSVTAYDTGESTINNLFFYEGEVMIGTGTNGKLFHLEEPGTITLLWTLPVTNLYQGSEFKWYNHIGTGNTGKLFRSTERVSATKDVTCLANHHYKWFKLPFSIKEADEEDKIRFTIGNNTTPLSPHIYIDIVGIVSHATK